MVKDLQTFSIEPTDTLTTISELLGIDMFELVRYHNSYSKSNAYIINNVIPKHVHEIFVPDYINIPKRTSNIVDELTKKGMQWNVSATYNIINTWVEKIHNTEETHRFLKKIKLFAALKKDYVEVIFTTEDIRIDKEDDDIIQMEHIALIMAKMYERVVIQFSLRGEIVDVLNLEEIQDNWHMAKEQLLIRNGNSPNDGITAYIIEAVDEEVKASKYIAQSLQHDYTYRLLLSGIKTLFYKQKQQQVFKDTMVYPSFFPEPIDDIHMHEQCNIEQKGNTLFVTQNGLMHAKEIHINQIAHFIARQVAPLKDLPDKTLETLPKAIKQKIIEKRTYYKQHITENLTCGVKGAMHMHSEALGMLDYLEHTIYCTYASVYEKKYLLTVQKVDYE
jgi:hypothetical protein